MDSMSLDYLNVVLESHTTSACILENRSHVAYVPYTNYFITAKGKMLQIVRNINNPVLAFSACVFHFRLFSRYFFKMEETFFTKNIVGELDT